MSKVLIIEDEADILDMYQVQFSVVGTDVLGADNLVDGYAMVKKEKPDLVLLDLLLSQKDIGSGESFSRGGYSLLEKLKADSETKDIKVIIFSNLDTQQDREEAIKKGATKYLVKSEMTPKKVVEVIQKLLQE